MKKKKTFNKTIIHHFFSLIIIPRFFHYQTNRNVCLCVFVCMHVVWNTPLNSNKFHIHKYKSKFFRIHLKFFFFNFEFVKIYLQQQLNISTQQKVRLVYVYLLAKKYQHAYVRALKTIHLISFALFVSFCLDFRFGRI